MMILAVLFAVVLLAFGVWALLAPRHHWTWLRPLWLVTSGWQWRDPERMEPSTVATRSGGMCGIVLGTVILVPTVLYLIDTERRDTEACEADREALADAVVVNPDFPIVESDDSGGPARERGLESEEIWVDPDDLPVSEQARIPSEYVQFTKDGRAWFVLGYAPRDVRDSQVC